MGSNKWVRAAIPALLLHCSIGTVYCWSVFSQEIADYVEWPKPTIEWAFSLAIFFLGMSAAFLGNIVEKDIHKSSLIATICFTLGMAGTGFFIWYGGVHKHSLVALIGIFLSYGCVMGIGLGTGYLSPVKTLMLWFKDRKGLATGLAVAGFGAAKAIASPIMEAMLKGLGEGGVYKMFYILAGVYFVMMFLGHLMLKKPDDWVEPQNKGEKPSILATIKTKPIGNYVGIWLMFYINITCGLALISQEKQIYKCIGVVGAVGVLSAISSIFNAAGRIGFSAWADTMKDRNTIYKMIFILSIAFTGIVLVTQGIKNGYDFTTDTKNWILISIVIAMIMVINAGYGGGFSNVPTLLSDHYGMGSISAIHGITLSAWAFAGLTGNQVASMIVEKTNQYLYMDKINKVIYTLEDATAKCTAEGLDLTKDFDKISPVGYQNVLYFVIALFVVALILCLVLVRPTEKALEAKAAKKAKKAAAK